jgi:short-subunit dehydrogenase
MNSDPFRDQVVIVTGASAGIGKSLALQLAKQGAKVVIAARRAERLEQIAGECRQLGVQVLVVPADVSDESQCKALIEKTLATFGRLDMLINNAGMAASALLDEFPNLRLFKQTMDINFYGTVYCTYHALPYLKQSQGRIVSISSLGGKSAIPYNTPYCASKYALHGFFDSLRMELTPHGVSCTVICPSWVVTEFHEAQLNKDGVPRGERGRAYYSKKMMTADQCARITLDAAQKRRREVLMGPGFWAILFKTLAPGLLDWLTFKLFLEPAIKRAKAGKIEVQS